MRFPLLQKSWSKFIPPLAVGNLIFSLSICPSFAAGTLVEEPPPYASGATAVINATPGNVGNAHQVLEDPNYTECGMECLYLKANNNITLQALFVKEKSDRIIETDQNSTDPGREQKLKKLLGNFCADSETIEDCKDRYLRLNKFWLVKARASIGKNQESSVNLKCVKFDQSGRCIERSAAPAISRLSDMNDPKDSRDSKLIQIPHFSKFKDLKKQGDQMLQNRIANVKDTKETKNWAEGFMPRIEDFIKFKTIPRDPTPGMEGLGGMEVPEMVGDKYVYDQKAYDIALKAWNEYYNNAKPAFDASSSKLKARNQENRDKLKQDKGTQDDMTSDGFIYNQARGFYTEYLNKSFEGPQGTKKKNANLVSQQNKGGAPNAKPTPTFTMETKIYTGEESVKNYLANDVEQRRIDLSADRSFFERPPGPKSTPSPNSVSPAGGASAATQPAKESSPPPSQELEISNSQDMYFNYSDK